VVLSAELAVVDAPSSVCANDGCVIEEEPFNIAGIAPNINSPNAKVISLFSNLKSDNFYRFKTSLIGI
jgi:hypothetical protein